MYFAQIEGHVAHHAVKDQTSKCWAAGAGFQMLVRLPKMAVTPVAPQVLVRHVAGSKHPQVRVGMHKSASSNSDNRWIYWVNTVRPSTHDSHTCVVSTSHLLYRETMVCIVRGVLQLKEVAADFAVTTN